MTSRKKLIEVAMPLEAINVASAAEKSPFLRRHPRALHVWWARRPLAACRAVLFASLVDDPSSEPSRFPTPKSQEDERTRLFGIIERLVRWENTTDRTVLDDARAEILRSTGSSPPPVLDPFCGGGSIPLEAQRLGLTSYASDLNPVAVLITKALTEIPFTFANHRPVHPDAREGLGDTGTWSGAAGLAEDVRRYGAWMRAQADARIGHVYPKVPRNGGQATATAWIWARTLDCPNPACRARMPLARSFVLSAKKGQEAWIQPVVDQAAKTVRFDVRTGPGTPPSSPKAGRGATFSCLVCGHVAAEDYVKSEGRAGRIGFQMMAIVATAERGRSYEPATAEDQRLAESLTPSWVPAEELSTHPQYMGPPRYGLTRFSDLFTPRQLVVLSTLTDLITEVRELVFRDALAEGFSATPTRLSAGGAGAAAYADAVATYLGLALSRITDFSNALASWDSGNANMRQLFARQVIQMSWDFAETNLLDGVVSLESGVQWVATTLDALVPAAPAHISQADAAWQAHHPGSLVSTDPPYYDNVPYADLSDFFYVWLRRSLKEVWPALLATILAPKSSELVADTVRLGGRDNARRFFDQGMRRAFTMLHEAAATDVPITIFYAYKQTESDESADGSMSIASTGWETMLEGLLASGFAVVGTWPMRTEQKQRSRALSSNALASSIVLVCRQRSADAGVTTRSDFVAALRRQLPGALRTLQHENIAPVDLAQSAIGPGIAVFSRFAKVIEPDGSPMSVRSALGLINSALDQILAEQEGEFDPDTRWAITWFEQHGMTEGRFGDADVLARAKDTAVAGLERAGIVRSGGGKVRLLRREELPDDWNPAVDRRPTVWEATQHLVRAFGREGEAGVGDFAARIGGYAELARDLAYRLYLICERKGWADEALAYNDLVVAWPEIERFAHAARSGEQQQNLNL